MFRRSVMVHTREPRAVAQGQRPRWRRGAWRRRVRVRSNRDRGMPHYAFIRLPRHVRAEDIIPRFRRRLFGLRGGVEEVAIFESGAPKSEVIRVSGYRARGVLVGGLMGLALSLWLGHPGWYGLGGAMLGLLASRFFHQRVDVERLVRVPQYGATTMGVLVTDWRDERLAELFEELEGTVVSTDLPPRAAMQLERVLSSPGTLPS